MLSPHLGGMSLSTAVRHITLIRSQQGFLPHQQQACSTIKQGETTVIYSMAPNWKTERVKGGNCPRRWFQCHGHYSTVSLVHLYHVFRETLARGHAQLLTCSLFNSPSKCILVRREEANSQGHPIKMVLPKHIFTFSWVWTHICTLTDWYSRVHRHTSACC